MVEYVRFRSALWFSFSLDLSGCDTRPSLDLTECLRGNLTSIDTTGNQSLCGNLEAFHQLKRRGCIRSIKLSACAQVHGSLSSLSSLVNLFVLDLSNCKLVNGSLECLALLRQLTYLDLSNAKYITGMPLCLSRMLKPISK